MKTDANKTGIEPEPRSGSLDAVVRCLPTIIFYWMAMMFAALAIKYDEVVKVKAFAYATASLVCLIIGKREDT